MGGELGGGMNLKSLKKVGKQVKQPQVLDDNPIYAGIDEFIKQANKVRDFWLCNDDIQGQENLARMIVSQP